MRPETAKGPIENGQWGDYSDCGGARVEGPGCLSNVIADRVIVPQSEPFIVLMDLGIFIRGYL
ncbi:MAG: hypothetical protein R3245_10195 [Kiloniellales bacterium]|nr:hypothetical protein [Kiloniellales bacterium]